MTSRISLLQYFQSKKILRIRLCCPQNSIFAKKLIHEYKMMLIVIEIDITEKYHFKFNITFSHNKMFLKNNLKNLLNIFLKNIIRLQ